MVRTVHANHFYEISLQISDPNENSFLKNGHVQNLENHVFGGRKAPAGWFHSKTKLVNTFRNIPDPIGTKLSLKNVMFIAKLLKASFFSD